MTVTDNRCGEPPVNVLLVDDLPANLLALEAILGDLGQNLVRAHSGEEALRLLAADDFAVVLLDVRMPGLSGFEAARLIRGRERSRATPIIFLTAAESPEFPVEEAYTLGAVDYLVKPLVPVILRAKVAGFVELHRQAERLRRSEERFRLLVDGTNDYALFLLDDAGRVTSWNHGAERLKQYRAEEVVGRHFALFYPAEDVAAGKPERGLRAAEAAGRFADEGWRVRKDGSRFWADVVITALRDDAGNLRGFSKITRDVTDRKEVEKVERRLLQESAARRAAEEYAEVLRSQREQLRVTLHSIGDAVITTDVVGRVTLLNRAAEGLTGWTNADAAGHALTEVFRIVNEVTRREAENPAERVLREGVVVGLANHTVLIARDGTQRPIDDSAAPIRDAAGNVGGVVLVFRDVTDKRRGEEALRESDRRKDEFLALLGHELRNPLAAIVHSVHLLALKPDDPGVVAQTRDVVGRQAGQMARLVEELLDASRIARGKVQLRWERLDLAALVRTAADDYRAGLEAAGLALAVEVPGAPVWVVGDAARLTQVVSNLLHNAVKFTDPGGRVTVRLAEGDGKAALTVADTGVGITAEALPRLFDVFSQADATLERSKGGLGLGLSVVKGLVELHGGRVEAASAGRGRGAAFTVRLALDRGTAAPPVPTPDPGPAVSRPLKVLVIEDNRDAADSLRMLLAVALGHEVAVAYSGPEGVEQARRSPPEVVLCDLGLPGLSGFDVARALRADPATAGALLVCVSGYGQPEDRRRALEAGFNAVLVKPVEYDTLARLLARPGF